MSELDKIQFPDGNYDPRCPCVLLLDASWSMNGEPIEELNEGLYTYQTAIGQDDLARRRVEIAIVTFGNGGVNIMQDFIPAAHFKAPTLSADGNTPMASAINCALDMLRSRKDMYKACDIPWFRPWAFLITDGEPTDGEEAWRDVVQRVHAEEEAKRIAFFAVGVASANMQKLAKLSVRQPMKLQGLKFKELFLWLSASQQRISASKVGEMIVPPSYENWGYIDG